MRWVPLEGAGAAAEHERDRRLVTQADERGRLVTVDQHVLVVGAGQMGGGIAQVVAASGRRVSLYDPFPGATERALADDASRASRSSPRRAVPTRPRCSRASASSTGSSPADLMIEAVVEDAAVKEEIFRRADAELPAHAILASNTSSIPIASLAAVTAGPIA